MDATLQQALAIVKSTGQRVIGSITDQTRATGQLGDFELQLLWDQLVSHSQATHAALDQLMAERDRRGPRPAGPKI